MLQGRRHEDTYTPCFPLLSPIPTACLAPALENFASLVQGEVTTVTAGVKWVASSKGRTRA